MNPMQTSTGGAVADELGQAARQGARALEDGVRDGASQARAAAQGMGRQLSHSLDCAVAYAEREPVRAALWAALAGGVLATAIACLLRQRG